MGKKEKPTITDYCASLLIILLLYAALSKMFDYSTFRQQLGQSPLLKPQMVNLISIATPFSEVLISLLLMIKKYQLLGFYLSIILLSLFTTYIILLLKGSFIPCSCGGILGKMDWNVHIVFNIFFIIIAVVGVLKTNIYENTQN